LASASQRRGVTPLVTLQKRVGKIFAKSANRDCTTPRRWLALANQPLSDVLDENIGRTWRTDLSQLSDVAEARREDLCEVRKQGLHHQVRVQLGNAVDLVARWLALANQPLSDVLDENIGRTWRTDLSQLSELKLGAPGAADILIQHVRERLVGQRQPAARRNAVGDVAESSILISRW
jgi:glucan phosphorylase